VIAKDLLERILVDMLHSASMDHYTANTFSMGMTILDGLIYEKVPGVAGLSAFSKKSGPTQFGVSNVGESGGRLT